MCPPIDLNSSCTSVRFFDEASEMITSYAFSQNNESAASAFKHTHSHFSEYIHAMAVYFVTVFNRYSEWLK